MLAKLLSNKQFFAPLGLGVLFLMLLLFKLDLSQLDLTSLLSLGLYFVTLVSYILFIYQTTLIKNKGYALWYFILLSLVFCDLALDLRLSAVYFFSTIILINSIYINFNHQRVLNPFDVGFYFTLIVFFYPPAAFFIVYILIYYFYTRLTYSRGLLLLFVGIFTSAIILLQLLYLTDELLIINEFNNDWCIQFIKSNNSYYFLIPLLIVTSVALVDHFSHVTIQDFNKRQSYFFVFLFLLNWLGIIVFFADKSSTTTFTFLCFPIALILTRFTQYIQQLWLREFLLWLLAIILLSFYYHKEIIDFYNLLLGNVSFQL